MKKRKLYLPFIALMIFGLLTGCTHGHNNKTESAKNETEIKETTREESSNTEKNYPVSIKNFDSQQNYMEETFDRAPERVAVPNATTAEILLELGLKDKIIAVPESEVMDKYKSDYDAIPKLPEKYNVEAVLETGPDFITGWYSFFNDEGTEDTSYWNEKGVKTFIQRNTGGQYTRDINNVYWDILDYGKIFHVEDEAEALVQEMQEKVHDLGLKISKHNAKAYKTYEEKPGVMVIEIAKDGEYRLYGQKALAHTMLLSLDIKDVTNGYGYGYRDEHLIERNPDVLFVVYFENSQTPEENVDAIYNNPGLQNIEAVKNKRVYPIPLGQMYGGGMRTIAGFETFAKNTYPELFDK